MLTAGFPVFGQEATTQVVQLKDLVREALERNPDILAARDRWKAAQARVPQVSTLPDPMLIFGIQNIGYRRISIGEMDMSMAGVGIQQSIPFPGKLGTMGTMAEKMAEQMQQEYAAISLSTLAKLKEAYYDLYLIHKSIEVVEKEKDVLQKFEKTAEAKYTVGVGIQQDVLKAQVEISMLLQRLEVLEQRKQSTIALINRLLNRPPEAPLPRPAEVQKAPFDLTLEQLNDLALENSPMLKTAERRIEEKEAGVSLAKKEYLPNFQLSAMANSRGKLEDMWQASLGIEIPLYWWRKQSKGVEEAARSLGEARHNYERTRQELLFEVKDNFVMAKTADTLVRLYGTAIIPQASLSLESATAGYEVGKVDFLTLLDNLITLLNDEIMYYEQLTDFQKALSRLEAVVGVPLME